MNEGGTLLHVGSDNQTTTDADGPSTSGVNVMSRRRMVFRPPAYNSSTVSGSSNPLNTLAAAAETLNSPSRLNSTIPNEDDHSESKRTTKPGRTLSYWGFKEVMVLYEALKIYGKDWDSVFRILQKRKIAKGKEQMKNFYFNCVKLVKSQANIDDDDLMIVSKDARELFIMINALEWKKKTGNLKYVPENIRQLVMEGSTCIRGPVKRKKQAIIVIKTPPCPALLKLFSLERRVEKFPSDITIQLEPMSYSDAAYVVACQRNPYLRVRMSTNDRLARLFQLLQVKWADNMKHLSEDLTENSIRFRIFPEKNTEVGKVVLTEVAAACAPSLNKLIRDREEAARIALRKKKQPCNTTPSYTVSVPVECSLVLSPDVLFKGIGSDNIQEASVAELYCVCGMSSEIRLVYQIGGGKSLPNAWNVMAQLLARDYGESVSNRHQDEELSHFSRKRDRLDDIADDMEDPISKVHRPSTRSSMRPPATVPRRPTAPRKPLVAPQSVVVDAENAAFMQQMQELKKQGTTAGRRRVPVSRVPRSSVFCTLAPPSAPSNAENDAYQKTITDFSSVNSIAGDENSSSTCSLLASLRTPEKKKPSTSTSTNSHTATTSGRHFDDEGTRLSRSDLSRHALEVHCFGGPLEDLSPMKSASGLPDDVRLSFDQMMNQNSMDFCANFQQLVADIDITPQKSRSGR